MISHKKSQITFLGHKHKIKIALKMNNEFWTKWLLWPKNVIAQILQSLYNFISTLEGGANPENEFEATNVKLHSLRLSLLDQLVNFLPSLREVGGPRCIPFIQVILMLTTGKNLHQWQLFLVILNFWSKFVQKRTK